MSDSHLALFDSDDFFLNSQPPGNASGIAGTTGKTDSEIESCGSYSSDDTDDDGLSCSESDFQAVPRPELHLEEFFALGSIRLREVSESGQVLMQGLHPEEAAAFPPPAFKVLSEKGILRTQHIKHSHLPNHSSMRVFALPEDVKGESRRWSNLDHRRWIKRLLRIVDTSRVTWEGSFDAASPIKTYASPADGTESLFHIYNTLASPNPALYPSGTDIAACNRDVQLVEGLKTHLYPYQRRSVHAMLVRETEPAKSVDPRKPLHHDLLDKPFYMDIHEGIILRQAQLYEESRGGVLGETMGYGKTLICLALICVTRGHFPSVPEGRLDITPRLRDRTASLLEMAATAAGRSGVSWKAEFHAMQKAGYSYESCVNELKKHHRKYVEPIIHTSTPLRKGKRIAEKQVQVCWSTLVIVPQNLLAQWQHEIKTHLEDDALDILVIENSKKPIPDGLELMKYDVVLITKNRLEQEYRDDDLHNGKRRAGEAVFQSPLTEMRWLRVICDEGHAFAGSLSRTNALAMLDKMYIERRWVVSGTPSNALVGVEVGIAADADSGISREMQIDQSLEDRRAPLASLEEAKDIEKLRQLVANVLKIPPWANRKGSDNASWKRYLAPFDQDGHRRKTACLRTLLQSLVVRHRIQDIDFDLDLPPLSNKTVYLEPSYYDKISLNLFTMVLTANMVTSERADEDYLFHQKNRKSLDVLIKNLRQSSFHWVGFTQENILETLKNSKKYFDSHIDDISDDDGASLMEAIMTGEKALGDNGWIAFSTLHEIGVYVRNFPEDSRQAWSLQHNLSNPLLLGIGQARHVQRHVEAHLEDPLAGLTGEGIRQMTAIRSRAAEQSTSPKKSLVGSQTSEEPTLKASSSPTKSVGTKRRRASSVSSLSQDSPLRRTDIVGFSSAKLTYLVDEVLQYHKSEKIIIFYDSGNVAYWIAEALELVSVKYLIYANTLTVARRASYLVTFNKSDEFRVLLMDLGQAALGLHVACASRVYVITPIWQPNTESQAIKRAHRIGQTRPVFVETLVLRGTLEEKMLRRRRQMTDGELKKASKSLLDDGTMNQMIKEQRFLKFKPSEVEAASQFAKLAIPRPLFGRVSRTAQNPEDGLVLVDGDVAAPARKIQKKSVRIESPV